MKPGMLDRWGGRPIEVLLVDDNPGHARLTQEILKDAKFETHITHVLDGDIAMAYLRNSGEFANAMRPDLVLLDLLMPNMDGREVLAAMSAEPNLKNLPVIVLTVSRMEEDLLRFDNFDPSRFCSKPIDLDRFDRILESLATNFQIPSEP